MLDFTRTTPKYDGNLETVCEWCKKLEIRLDNHEWESIPNEKVTNMLLSSIIGTARQERVLLHPSGLAFAKYETGEFFTELLKKLLQEKDKKGQKQEVVARKQGRNEDPRKFYMDKMILWVQAYTPANGVWQS